MRPLRLPGSSWLLPVAEVEQGPAPAGHDRLTGRPRRDLPAVPAEEPADQARVAGMVHADDPLAPREVLGGISRVGPFPVQDRGDFRGGRVEQDVVGAIIAVHEDVSPARGAGEGGGDLAGVDAVDAPQHGAAGAQHVAAPAGVQQLLAVDAGHERHGQALVPGAQDGRHRDPALQRGEHGALVPGPGQRAGALVALGHGGAVPERAVGVAVPKRPHGLVLAVAGARPRAPGHGPAVAGWPAAAGWAAPVTAARRKPVLPSASVLSMNWSTAPVAGSRRTCGSAMACRSAAANRPASMTW